MCAGLTRQRSQACYYVLYMNLEMEKLYRNRKAITLNVHLLAYFGNKSAIPKKNVHVVLIISCEYCCKVDSHDMESRAREASSNLNKCTCLLFSSFTWLLSRL